MKICFLAPADNPHTKKWCDYFSSREHEVHLVSLHDGFVDSAIVHSLTAGVSASDSDIRKLKYLTYAHEVRAIIDSINPDIVNAHYASSYGSLAALACKRPYVLSVWGADVYDFPKKTWLHEALIRWSLRHATWLFSTSSAMVGEIHKYTDKTVEITPFGVDTSLFKPRQRVHGSAFVVSTVKALSAKYGIDVLLEAVAEVIARRPDIPLRVRIAGKGPDERALRGFADGLGLSGIVEWLGFLSQNEVSAVWSDSDVAVVASMLDSESFGVSAVEAQACGAPIIVSDIPGLMESTVPGGSSLVFPRGDAHELALKIEYLYDNPSVRVRMGECGVEHVKRNYELNECFNRIERLFRIYSRV